MGRVAARELSPASGTSASPLVPARRTKLFALSEMRWAAPRPEPAGLLTHRHRNAVGCWRATRPAVGSQGCRQERLAKDPRCRFVDAATVLPRRAVALLSSATPVLWLDGPHRDSQGRHPRGAGEANDLRLGQAARWRTQPCRRREVDQRHRHRRAARRQVNRRSGVRWHCVVSTGACDPSTGHGLRRRRMLPWLNRPAALGAHQLFIEKVEQRY